MSHILSQLPERAVVHCRLGMISKHLDQWQTNTSILGQPGLADPSRGVDKMKIDRVEAFVVSHKLKETFYFSQHHYDTRTICLTRITLDNGLSGWGEGYGPAGMIKAGIEFLAPLVLGGGPVEQETLWQAMYLRSLDHARGGILLSALSAIDIALWDLKGKILGAPVSVLLGGRKREAIRAYATGLYFSTSHNLKERLAEEAAKYMREGFTALKMKVGLGIDQDVENVCAVRAEIGPEPTLMIDAKHAFCYQEALGLVNELEPFNIAWFEEPLSPEDYGNYRELRRRSRIPIAAGECEHLRYGFLRLFRQHCVDIAQPDPCAAGGITETKKIADLAQVHGVDFAPHCWGSCIAVATALHLLSNWDPYPGRILNRDPILELDRMENPFREDLASPRPILKESKVEVPKGPGLGIEIDEDLVTKYTVEKFSTS